MLGTYPLSTLPLSTLEAVVVEPVIGRVRQPRKRRAVVTPSIWLSEQHDARITPAKVWTRSGGLTSSVEHQDELSGVSYKLRLRGEIEAVIDRVDSVEGVRAGVKSGRVSASLISRAGSVNAVKVGVKVDSANYTIERFSDITPTRAGIFSGFATAATHRLESVGNTVSGVSVGYLGAVLIKAPVEQFVDEPLQMVGRREARRAAMQIKAAWKFAGKVDSRLLELMERDKNEAVGN